MSFLTIAQTIVFKNYFLKMVWRVLISSIFLKEVYFKERRWKNLAPWLNIGFHQYYHNLGLTLGEHYRYLISRFSTMILFYDTNIDLYQYAYLRHNKTCLFLMFETNSQYTFYVSAISAKHKRATLITS